MKSVVQLPSSGAQLYPLLGRIAAGFPSPATDHLDRRLDLPAGASLEKVLAAMKGHVLASGEARGTFAKPR